MKFIKANQAITFGQSFGDLIERILHAFDFVELAMHAAHEFVKMQAGLALHWHGRVESVHQEALATSDSAPQVHTLWNVRTTDQALDRVGPTELELLPFVKVTLQAFDRDTLGCVRLVAPLGKCMLVVI